MNKQYHASVKNKNLFLSKPAYLAFAEQTAPERFGLRWRSVYSSKNLLIEHELMKYTLFQKN